MSETVGDASERENESKTLMEHNVRGGGVRDGGEVGASPKTNNENNSATKR